MKHTMSKKWLSVGLVALSFAGTVGAVTNDPFAAHKATVDRDIGLINTGKAVSVSDRTMEAARMIEAMEKSADHSLLPYFAEKSLDADTPKLVRSLAATAYVKIADLEESLDFMRKIFAINDNKGYWRSTIAPLFLQKVETAISNHTITDKTLQRVLSVLVAYAQSPANSQEADYVDVFLIKHCVGYQTSIQRLSMAKSISDGGNELEKNHFLPIKESVEALPKKQRTDLRARYPGLPPLHEEPKSLYTHHPWPVWAGIVAVGVAVMFAVMNLMLKRKKRRDVS